MMEGTVVEKSPNDQKEYRAITLDNGIRALLICDNRTVTAGSKKKRVVRKDSDGDSEQEEEEEEEEIDDESDEEDSECEDSGGEEDGQKKSGENTNQQRIRSACGVCIRTGSYCDPPEVPGLAHLLEHMVFMGSKKYPGENTFDAFTSKHGGFVNAVTDYERTTFQFCIHPQYFREALDMFAHFFASPSLLKRSLDREIEAVDNEFQMAVQNDRDRLERLIVSLAKPGHPLLNFVWGNRESLKKLPRRNGVDLFKILREYYTRHYSSHYMTVVVMSCYPLDELEKWTRESFAPVPNNGLPLPLMLDNRDAYDEATFTKLYKVVPVKDTHKLRLTWLLPPQMDMYKTKPLEYVSWLLGHEGEGSVYAELKKRNLATALVAGNGGTGYEYNTAFSLFFCEITLADKGYEDVFQYMTLVFQYLKMLKDAGPRERIYREIQEINKNDFDFVDDEEPYDFVQNISELMQLYPVEHYLTGDYLLFEYNPTSISSILSLLTPDRANIMVMSKMHASQCKLKERWFGTKYCVTDIPEKWKESWQDLEAFPALHEPKPNQFIATDFSIIDPDTPATKYPVVVEESPKFNLWYKKGEPSKKCPKAWVCLHFRTPVYVHSPEYASLLLIFLNMYCRNTSEVVYSASVAQLDFSVEVSRDFGVNFVINGFNHKISLLFQELIKYFIDFKATEEDFTTSKEIVRKSLSNELLKPKKLCKLSRVRVLEHYHWTPDQKLATLDQLTLSSLLEFVKQFKRQLFVEALVQGNISVQEAQAMIGYLIEQVQFDPLPRDVRMKIQPRTMKLPSNNHILFNLANRNSQSTCTVLTDYYQCCERTTRDAVIAQLLSGCMVEPSFNQLRTQQQLGYEVYPEDHNTHGVLGLSLTLVTHATKFSDDYASACMAKFVHDFHIELSKWTHEHFQDQVDALIQEKREPDLSLEEEVTRNWIEVQLLTYNFDILEQEARELETITQQEVCDWLHKYTHPGSDYRRLTVKVISKHPKAQRVSSPEGVSNPPTPTLPPPLICPQCSTCCSVDSEALPPFESSVDPPSSALVPQPSSVTLCEGVEACGGCSVEEFKAGLYAHPSQSGLSLFDSGLLKTSTVNVN